MPSAVNFLEDSREVNVAGELAEEREAASGWLDVIGLDDPADEIEMLGNETIRDILPICPRVF